MFFLIFFKTCKIKPVCLSHIALLPSFIALFSCSLLHCNTELIFCMGDFLGDIVMKQAQTIYTTAPEDTRVTFGNFQDLHAARLFHC